MTTLPAYYNLDERAQSYALAYYWREVLETHWQNNHEIGLDVKDMRRRGMLGDYTLERIADICLRASGWMFNEHGNRIA